MAISPLIHYFAGKLRPIIDGNGLGKTDSFSSFRKCCSDFMTTDGRIGQKQWASSGILIDNGENTERAAVDQPRSLIKSIDQRSWAAEAAGSETRLCAARFLRFFVRTSSPSAL